MNESGLTLGAAKFGRRKGQRGQIDPDPKTAAAKVTITRLANLGNRQYDGRCHDVDRGQQQRPRYARPAVSSERTVPSYAIKYPTNRSAFAKTNEPEAEP